LRPALLALATWSVVFAQQQQPQEIHTLKIQGNVYLLAGAGGNVVAQVGDDGVLLVDTGLANRSADLIAAIKKLSDKPLQWIVNTHVHPDHTGGNAAVAAAGVTITGANVTANLTDIGTSAQIIGHENVLMRLSAPTGKQAAATFPNWPTQTYVSGQKELFFNEEPIEIRWMKSAHTDGDSIVFFRRSDVVVAGDTFTMTSYPFIDLANGGSIEGEIEALNTLIDIAIPKHHEEGGTYIVPGHGRICDQFDVVEYRDMVTIVRDRVRAAIKKDITLDQVKKAGYTKDFDGRYAPPGAFINGEAFVEAIYKSLNAKK
jgi:glyoxylase-like metal-dependent hydrolase (beta-lactamase superfamily II)